MVEVKRVKLKPMINVDIPQDFSEVIKSKLKGKVLKTGDVVSVDILGKEIRFKVVQAMPSPLTVDESTGVLLTRHSVETLEINVESVEDVLLGDDIIVVIRDNEVLILNHDLEEIYRERFENLKKVMVKGNVVVVIDGEKLKLIRA
ncbi:Hypothetical protein PAB0458 [Pyrococcus abyssi GE5]|uniref:Putative ATPase n=1 Tax=Pyrococcus abyssi (strain GE5 / Orsay) TaxID=272844 RepID=Q9V0W7_PYRAB|nr:Hypothetical protein PAB0458 [Pyrococcus abyssi GE5]CCE70057.1 TPA: Putative ATPase [Pyrococcus abyssi GE5]